MRACHAVNGHIVFLLDVEENFVEGVAKGLVSVWNVAEIALDPVGFRRNVEGECFGAVVGTL